jgi:hypothetical protein
VAGALLVLTALVACQRGNRPNVLVVTIDTLPLL